MNSPDSLTGQAEDCPECGNVVVVPQEAPPPVPIQEVPPTVPTATTQPLGIAGRHWIICPNPNCGYRGAPRRESRGSIIIAIILCCLFIVPGLIYLVLVSGYDYMCPQCGIQVGPGTHE